MSIDIRLDVRWVDVCLYQRHSPGSDSVPTEYTTSLLTGLSFGLKAYFLLPLSVQYCIKKLNSCEAKQTIILHFKLNYLYLFWQRNIWGLGHLRAVVYVCKCFLLLTCTQNYTKKHFSTFLTGRQCIFHVICNFFCLFKLCFFLLHLCILYRIPLSCA